MRSAVVFMSLCVSLAGCGGVVGDGHPLFTPSSAVNNGTTVCISQCSARFDPSQVYDPWNGGHGYVVTSQTSSLDPGQVPSTVYIGVDSNFSTMLWFTVVSGGDSSYDFYASLPGTLNTGECFANISAPYTPPNQIIIAPPPGGKGPGSSGDPKSCGGYNVCIDVTALRTLATSNACFPPPPREPPPPKCHGLCI